MAEFRKKPVVIEAFQWTGDHDQVEDPAWIVDAIRRNDVRFLGGREGPLQLVITTLEGDHRADVGDWIIKGVKGELYPCKPDIFAMTYEAV